MRATLLLLILTLTVSNRGQAATSAPVKPNFIVVLIDDLGWGDFSCFGNRDARTPCVDQLAAEGLRFAQFYVNAPICSPSRTALTTGCYPQRFRIGSFLDNRAANSRRGMANWLDPGVPTLPRMLHAAGYATGHFGKWHMGGQRNVGDAPLISDYGFDRSLTNFEGLGVRALPLLVRPNETKPQKHALGSDRLGRGEITWRSRSEITTAFVDAAIEFIDQRAFRNQPFYVNVWPDDVHSPFTPPLDEWGDGSKRSLYLAVLESMDRQLGALFDHVRDTPELRENTVILLCSDNGPEPGAGSAGEFRGGKGSLLEGGIRSPLIVWAPTLMRSNAIGKWKRDSYFSAVDLVPSILELAAVPPAADTAFDGESVAETLTGHSTAGRASPLFFRRPPDRDKGYGLSDLPDLAARSGNSKLLCEYDGSKPQLYDVLKDAGESHNLAAEQPEVVTELTKQVLAWHVSLPADGKPASTEKR
jgi:arylsulfatase A-like enzyme